MEKEMRRKSIDRRQQLVEVSVEKRIGIERRSKLDRRVSPYRTG